MNMEKFQWENESEEGKTWNEDGQMNVESGDIVVDLVQSTPNNLCLFLSPLVMTKLFICVLGLLYVT